MKTYQISVPDNLPEEELKTMLASLGLSLENETTTWVQGNYLPTEKPSDFVPIWANDERTLEQIREKAWKRK
jgi:hypothetical protein